MGYLKSEKTKKCFSLLREFIEQPSTLDEKKKLAGLALDQLQKITGGTDSTGTQDPSDGTATGEEDYRGCVGRPRSDGTPVPSDDGGI